MAAGEEWDRRQLAEDRWRKALDDHEQDALAHSRARHELMNTLAARFLQLEARVTRIELSRAEEHGEWKATRRAVLFGASAVSVLVTAFGGAILVKLGAI